MKCPIELDHQACCNYYNSQSGGAIYDFYRGQPVQGGAGIFSGLFRTVSPILKGRVLPQLIKAGAGVVADKLQGRSLGSSILRRGAKAVKNIITGEKKPAVKRKRPISKLKSKKRKKVGRNLAIKSEAY